MNTVVVSFYVKSEIFEKRFTMWRSIGELRKFAAENGSAAVAKHAAESVERISKLNAVVASRAAGDKEVVDFSPDLPLSCVPLAVKDNFCVEGVATTCGSKMLSSFVPAYSATVVSR